MVLYRKYFFKEWQQQWDQELKDQKNTQKNTDTVESMGDKLNSTLYML